MDQPSNTANGEASGPVAKSYLSEQLGKLPRVMLARVPTPIEISRRLSEELGVEVWFKRDDLTGGALSGNKARVLEYVLGDALAQGADCVIVGGPIESNYHRVLAAAAAKVGIQAIAVLRGDPQRLRFGNPLLSRLLGAELHYCDAVDRPGNEAAKDALASDLAARGHHPYIIRGDFAESAQATLGTIAYVGTALELVEQFQAAGIHPEALFVASTGPTWTGLCLGFDLLGQKISVHGVGYGEPASAVATYRGWLATSACRRLQLQCPEPGAHPFDDRFVGYGRMSALEREAITLVAHTAGILLDPLYGAKAMASLISNIREGILARGTQVAFLNTGGSPALFDPISTHRLLDTAGEETFSGFPKE